MQNSIKKVATQFVLLLSIGACSSSNAGGCSAHNDNGASCSIDCPEGQAANCQNATGANSPTCECSGNLQEPYKKIIRSKFLSYDQGKFIKDEKNLAPIETTDIVSVINAKLNTLRSFYLTDECRDEDVKVCVERPSRCITSANESTVNNLILNCRDLIFPEICHKEKEHRCTKVIGKLQVYKSVYLEKPAVVTVDEPNWNDIPTEQLGFKEVYINCTNEKQTYTFSHKEILRVGARVTKSKVVKTGTSLSAEVKFNFMKTSSYGLGFKFDHSVQISDSKSDDFTIERDRSFQLPVVVSAMTVSTVTHTFISRLVTVPFKGVVQVDSMVTPNKEGVTRISQLLKKPEDRIFKFSGSVDNTNLSEGKTENYSEKIDVSECKKQGAENHFIVRSSTFTN